MVSETLFQKRKLVLIITQRREYFNSLESQLPEIMEGQTSPSPPPAAAAASISVAAAVRLFPVTDPFSTPLSRATATGLRLDGLLACTDASLAGLLLLPGQLPLYHGGDASHQVQQGAEGHGHGVALRDGGGLHLVEHLQAVETRDGGLTSRSATGRFHGRVLGLIYPVLGSVF